MVSRSLLRSYCVVSAMKNIHKCGSCLLRSREGLCQTAKRPVNENDEACRWYVDTSNTVECELCGNTILTRDSYLFNEDRVHITCGECATKKMGRCATCMCVKECTFETDPSPIPQVVQKRIQQGPMTQIIQVMNPDRIAITCRMGCKCWDNENNICHKQNSSTCGQYQCLWE